MIPRILPERAAATYRMLEAVRATGAVPPKRLAIRGRGFRPYTAYAFRLGWLRTNADGMVEITDAGRDELDNRMVTDMARLLGAGRAGPDRRAQHDADRVQEVTA